MTEFDYRPARILVVDDDDTARGLVVRVLSGPGRIADAAADGASALEQMSRGETDCCVVDVNMPGISGLDLLSRIATLHPETPVVIVTGESSLENAVEAIRRGAYDFLTKPLDVALLRIAVDRALEKRRFLLERCAAEARLEREVREKTRELAIRNRQLSIHAKQLEDVTIGIISTMLIAMEAKEPYTAGHSVRVREYSLRVGRRLRLSGEELKVLGRAAKLHDIGKLAVECSSISKPGPLSESEWDRVLRHPEVGERMLQPFTALARERGHIRHHHERFDGRGYPDGISGNQIPLLTEILSVADTFDAMTSARSYRARTGVRHAVDELKRSVGGQFSDRVVPAFVEMIESGEIVVAGARARAAHHADVRSLMADEPAGALPVPPDCIRGAKLDG